MADMTNATLERRRFVPVAAGGLTGVISALNALATQVPSRARAVELETLSSARRL